MGKLSRLRLKQPSKDKKREEGVVAAELAVLSGGVLPGNGKEGGAQADGKDVSPAPSVSRGKRQSGR
ncbi:MAG: hypothetical protein KKC76_17450 [Proteobacteria bacterium]|nr:hypothetical protein [Pseudomonadota bacterium]MBU4297921.1 hypothetical protein [Pseudomonadota bacterium]MCG2746041.1 hypothetical protein [Desulfobulbaceae bacterium]